MRAYSNPNLTKDIFTREIRAHQAADNYIQGTYWNDRTSRGCAIGCAVETINRCLGVSYEPGDHQAIADTLDVAVELLHVHDAIFEGLPKAAALDWPLRFAEAISVGADTSAVWPRFAAWVLRAIVLPTVPPAEHATRAAIERVANGMATNWAHDDRGKALHDVETPQADDAVFAVWNAAMSAAWVARTTPYALNRAVLMAARTTAHGSRRVDKTNSSAAWNAAEHTACIRMADQLVAILKECR